MLVELQNGREATFCSFCSSFASPLLAEEEEEEEDDDEDDMFQDTKWMKYYNSHEGPKDAQFWRDLDEMAMAEIDDHFDELDQGLEDQENILWAEILQNFLDCLDNDD